MTEGQIEITVNGTKYRRKVEARLLLADFIRHDLGLTGTHIGCEHGVCGACTVRIDGRSARSCLHFAIALDGAEIATVEGMEEGGRLHPLQESFKKHHALQCGYCTPGMLMVALDLLEQPVKATADEVRSAISINLCRCTGYANIVRAIMESTSAEAKI